MVAIAVFTIISYLLVGSVIARKVFVYKLGDSPRTKPKHGTVENTDEYESAYWAAFFTLPLWFLVGPFCWVTSTTPHEKHLRRAVEEKELKIRFKELEKEVAEFSKTNYSGA